MNEKMFKLKITFEEYGGSFNENEISSEVIIENDDIMKAKENLFRLKTAVEFSKIAEGTKPENYDELIVPEFIKFDKSKYSGSLSKQKTILTILFVDDSGSYQVWSCYSYFMGRYNRELLSAEIICGLSCEF